MPELITNYTSTGEKFFLHREVMRSLANGKGRVITCHLMATDVCSHSCAFCSVQSRVGDRLPLADMLSFVDILIKHGLKAVIISGGGNPLLYRCPVSKAGIADLIVALNSRNLEVGMITDGMKLKDYFGRKSYPVLPPDVLDMLAWLRISMAGLDHIEDECYVPDVDPNKTALGFSYVYHDLYTCPEDPAHGKVSTLVDLEHHAGKLSGVEIQQRKWPAQSRVVKLQSQIYYYAATYDPRYVRLLPNCLEPSLIEERCGTLSGMASIINERLSKDVVFVQHKPPKAPKSCFLGYIHPVLNASGRVFPCDSVVLNDEAGHKFDDRWSICHWSEIGKLYEEPVRSLINDPGRMCPGCVFTKSNELLTGVVERGEIGHAPVNVEHPNFV